MEPTTGEKEARRSSSHMEGQLPRIDRELFRVKKNCIQRKIPLIIIKNIKTHAYCYELLFSVNITWLATLHSRTFCPLVCCLKT
jgi:hypothetical protein